MKKIISILTVFALLTNTASYAAEAVLDSASKGIIKIKGQAKPYAEVKILITNPEFNSDTAMQKDSRQYADTIFAGNDGKYEHDVIINDNTVSVSGNFNIYVKEGENQVQELSAIFYATPSQKYNCLKTVIADTSSLLNDEQIINVLGLNSKLYKSIDMTKLALKLSESLAANPITADDNDSDEIKVEKFSDLSERIRQFAVIQAYREGKSEIVFNDNKGFEFDDIMKFQTMDSDNGISVFDLYNNNITLQGKELIQNALLNTSADSIDDIKRLFAKNVMFFGIKYNNETGYGHVSKYVTSENVCYALNIPKGSTPVENYLSLLDKANADYNVVSNLNKLTIDNFLEIIEECSKMISGGNTENSQGSASSSSGNSGGNFVISFPVSDGKTEVENDDKNNNDNNADKSVFEDVPLGHWANDACEYLAEKGIINGIGNGLFAPADKLTREQAVKIICTALNIHDIKTIDPFGGQAIDVTDYSMFDDVVQGQWYSESVYAAYRHNIINGVAPKIFGVGLNITREDAAVILYRALYAETDTITTDFGDDSQISDYAKPAVSYMKEKGIIKGYEDNTFKPKSSITRAEMAQIVYNILLEG